MLELPSGGHEIDCTPTRLIITDVIGQEEHNRLYRLHAATAEHELAVGQLAMEFLLAAGCNDDLALLAALGGGLHDRGKYFPTVLPYVRQADVVFDEPTRGLVRREHTYWGFELLMALAVRRRESRLLLPAIVAGEHHTPLSPRRYTQLEPKRALAYGIVDVVQVFDALHALAFDETRTYVGTLPPATILHEVMKHHPEDPVIEGRALAIRPYLAALLGVDPHEPPSK